MVKRIILWALVIGCMGMIFMFSAQPANESTDLSDGLLIDILNFFDIKPEVKTLEFLSFFIRKTAHFCIYALLGSLVYLLLKEGYGKTDKMSFLSGLVVCFIYASTDEMHQLFTAGRSGQIGDVILDFFGSLTGIGIVQGIYFLIRRRKNG